MSAEILLARDGEPVAEGELRYVFVESGGGSTAPIPEPIRVGLARYQQADGS
jgi:acyl-CoA thioesterase FadM